MNTEAKAKRKVVLTIVMIPDEDRQVVKVEASAKSTLAPVTPVGTSLVITADGNGEMMLAEIGFFPADGGVWKLEATRNVAAYFEEKLNDLIETGAVVVIR